MSRSNCKLGRNVILSNGIKTARRERRKKNMEVTTTGKSMKTAIIAEAHPAFPLANGK